MFSANNPEIFWLTTTNIILGLVVFACIASVGWAIYQELRHRNTKRSSLPASQNHAVVIPFVGPTMADGGEPVGNKTLKSGQPIQPNKKDSRPEQSGK